MRRQILVMFYFCFTTLTTVGLGDFHPRGDAERLLVIPFMFFGVISLTVITEGFQSIVGRLNSISEGFEEYGSLQQFLQMLRFRYNCNQNLGGDYEKKIYDFFENRWNHHKTQFLQDSNDWMLLHELPQQVQLQILRHFIYPNFCMKFNRLLRFKN